MVDSKDDGPAMKKEMKKREGIERMGGVERGDKDE